VEPAARSSGTARAGIERAFALTSVVPLGAYVVLHVFDYARVLAGVQTIGARHPPPAWQLALEALFVWLPLAAHVTLALPLWRARRREQPVDGQARALLVMHRLAGVVILGFLADHFVRFRLPILQGRLEPADSVQHLAAELSRTQAGFPWVAALHLLGTIAVAFHLTFGLRRIALRSARLATSSALRATTLALGVLLLFAGLFTLIQLAAG
jgi:succinate dehydrogenase/fumarate reductase cytochrome b subunit